MDWFMPSSKVDTVLPPSTAGYGESELEKDLARRKRYGSLILTGNQGVTDNMNDTNNDTRKMFGV